MKTHATVVPVSVKHSQGRNHMSVDQKPVKKIKPTATALAFREYERVSYYLATQGDFDFKTDDRARAHFYASIDTNVDSAKHISYLTDQRSTGTKIPKGAHIDGLDVRTKEREKQLGKQKPEKQAAVKTPKVEKLAATPSMKRLLKKKGATSVDEAGTLA